MPKNNKRELDAWLLSAIASGALLITADVPTNREVISDLRTAMADLRAEEATIWATIDSANKGGPTAEQLARLDAIEKDFKVKMELVERREKLEAKNDYLDTGIGRKTSANGSALDISGGGNPDRGARPIDRDDLQRHGFQTLGHFAEAVVQASVPHGVVDGRLRHFTAAESNFQKSSVGEDGGYLIPPAYMREIYQKVKGDEALLPRTKNMHSDSDVAHMLVNEEQPGITSGGVQAYWVGEGADMTRTRSKLKNKMMELHELGVLIFTSNKSLKNASLLGSFIRQEAPKAINQKLNDSFVAGDGVAKPRGVLNSPSKIVVAKEAGQAADTVLYKNIVKMWNRLDASCRANALWLINQDAEPQLELMEFPTTTGATAVPVYLPPGGAADTPYARLKGRPVLPVEPCKTLGDEGDIILTDLNTYLTLTAGGGIEEDTSAHLAFDQNLTAFRFMFSVYGDSLWQAPKQPQNGTTTYSNIVTLAARA